MGDWELDTEKQTARASDLHFQIFGYQPPYPPWSLDRFLSHVVESDRERVRELIQTGLTRGTDWAFECRILSADGQEKWLWVSARFSQTGKRDRVIGVCQDITFRKAEEARQARMLQGMSEACFALDRQWRFTFVNDRCQTLLRHSRELMLGNSIWEVFRALVGTPMEGFYRQAMAERRAISFETFSPIAERWLDIRLYPSPEGLAAFLLDIHERKLGQSKLRKSEEQWAAVLENLHEGLVLSDLQGNLLHWNRAGLNLCGFSDIEEALVPRPEHAQTLELSDATGRVLALEEWPLSRVLRGERVKDLELNLERKDLGLERTLSYSGAIVKDASDRPLAFLSMRDVTARRQAERELLESEKRFRGTLDSMMEGCQILGRDWRYLYLNEVAARHGKRQISELLGQSMLECYPGIEQTPVFASMQRAMEGGPPEQVENTFTYPDGTQAVFQLHIQAVKEGVFVLSLDVTERKAAEDQLHSMNLQLEHRVSERTAQLEAANKELEAFSYSVSHDLRTPLRAIDGFSSMLASKYAEQLPPEARRFLENIRRGTRRMGRLIDDLLQFSHVSRHTLRRKKLDTRVLVKGVVEELLQASEPPTAQVEIGELPPSWGDRGLLRLVWMNLIANAVKYSRKRETPKICIGARANATFFISDNGTGFDMRYADKLFGVFQRLHRAEEFEGTGVGLAIVERIIHRHGGTIWADARLDEGATFYFQLPPESREASN